MKQYNRIMLGKSSCYADECRKNNFIGADFDILENLTGHLSNNWKEFNQKYIPVYMLNRPDKSKTAAGVACGFLYTICKNLQIGDVVLCPDGKGYYYVGTINSDYYYNPGGILPHRRNVIWQPKKIKRTDMSKALQNSTSSIGTCCNITKYADEIENLMKTAATPSQIANTSLPKTTFLERDLHKVFCNNIRTENIIGKTIYHEKSSNKIDSNQKWVHPDIVGVKFEEFKEETTHELQKVIETKKVLRLYSYEMKRSIDDDYQLKQYYFQAVSNSSWANYGYLVAYEIDESLQEEINRLNSAFGIGVLLLQAKEIKILCPAREKELDFDTIDKLCHLNADFKAFISGITKVMKAPKGYTDVSLEDFQNKCDDIFDSDKELENYCTKNCIPF